jgi:phenylpropionate dioxygenase-like ring-hydroxylating dioxygenase large terminal subunit
MTGREQLVAMARRIIAHAEANTIDPEDDVWRVPVERYYDPRRWQAEMDRIFKRLPLTLAFSCELREPGAYKSLDAAGVPVLLSRGADGAVRAFVNMCSHRGAVVVPEGSGVTRRFTCPYHAWTYSPQGDLVGLRDRDDFGPVDLAGLGLTPLPVAERAGLIFVVVTPGAPMDIDAFLDGYDEVLATLGLEHCVLAARQTIPGPNWKLAYDGYLDLYHLPILHRESFGADTSSKAIYNVWGPHQRVTSPDRYWRRLGGMPEEEWTEARLNGGVWTIFPHVSIAAFDAGGKLYMVSQLFPGPTPEQSMTVQNFLATFDPTDAQRELIAGQVAFLDHVVRDEDYGTGLSIQRTLPTGAKKEVLFGRNEGGGHRFHRWTDALIETDDADLLALLTAGLGEAR